MVCSPGVSNVLSGTEVRVSWDKTFLSKSTEHLSSIAPMFAPIRGQFTLTLELLGGSRATPPWSLTVRSGMVLSHGTSCPFWPKEQLWVGWWESVVLTSARSSAPCAVSLL